MSKKHFGKAPHPLPRPLSQKGEGELTGTVKPITQPDALGHWGRYGGRFVPETLMAPLEELSAAYEVARADESFQRELDSLLRDYAGRPTPLFLAQRLTKQAGGARIYLNRKDTLNT